MSKHKAVLGIDLGTQGLTVLLVNIDDPRLPVVATGEATYEFVPNVAEGCYEQWASDWEGAMEKAMEQIREFLDPYEVVAIGIAGQMHGQVLVDSQGQTLGTVRLWCDSRNQREAETVSDWFGMTVSLPKRITVARWLWSIRNQPDIAKQTSFMTTPAGWLSFRLTNTKALGIGDASGMFPMDSTTLNYRSDLLQLFDTKIAQEYPEMPALSQILPRVVPCGQDAGCLSQEAAQRLGLPVGIPVAAAEGDQPAALVGSLIGEAGMASCSFGTSVCANLVGTPHDPPILSPMVNHFTAVNGQPIYMVWLRNGTTFFNTMVNSYGGDFDTIMPQVLQAAPDCGGLLSLPFMDDEPGLQVHRGGTALTIGWNQSNATPGNACKAALLSTMFNLLKGTQYLQEHQIPMTEILLSGGLTKTPETGQIVANVFGIPVRLLEGAEEGCSWGAAVLAKYRYDCLVASTCSQSTSGRNLSPTEWPTYLRSITGRPSRIYEPVPKDAEIYKRVYQRYQNLLTLESQLFDAVSND